MKSERKLLGKELKVLDDEPFLNAYFMNELKIAKGIKEKGKFKVNS